DGIVIGKVKYRVFIKFRDHWYAPVPACRGNMLPECITVPATCWIGYRRHQYGVFISNSFNICLAILEFLLSISQAVHHLFPTLQKGKHVIRKGALVCITVKYMPIDIYP